MFSLPRYGHRRMGRSAGACARKMSPPGLPPCDADHNFRTIQNNSGLPQGLAGRPAAGWRGRGDGAGNKWPRSESARLTELPSRSGFAMVFASYLGDLDAETNRVLDVALEMTRAALGLADNFADGIIARQIVELSRTGERNPDLLCEGALKKLGEALFGD